MLLSKQGLSHSLGRDTTTYKLVDGRLRLKVYPDIALVTFLTDGTLVLLDW